MTSGNPTKPCDVSNPPATAVPRVSVVIPCYNCEDYVGEAIESVLGQTYPNVELVVVDDGSTDGSLGVIESFGGRIRWETGPNRGGCAARNRGAELTSGQYLMFLDADDRIEPDTLAELASVIDPSREQIAACPWDFLRETADGGRWERSPGHALQPPVSDAYGAWLAGEWYISTCALLWTRRAYRAVGKWDEALLTAQDTDIMLRALLYPVELKITNRGRGIYRKYPPSRQCVSRLRSEAKFRSQSNVFHKAEDALRERGRLEEYRTELGRRYFYLSIAAIHVAPGLRSTCLDRAKELAGEATVARWWCEAPLWKRWARVGLTAWSVVRRHLSSTSALFATAVLS